MPNRLILPLLCAASVAFASGSFTQDDRPIASKHHAADRTAVIATTFDVTRVKDNGETVRFVLHVANNTKKMVELQFPDGQTHDFVVNDATGKEVWRWSAGRMFTSAMRSKTLKGRAETVFEESWDAKDKHGSFTATATLRSGNFPVETSVDFVLP